jgi:hypothetical protein
MVEDSAQRRQDLVVGKDAGEHIADGLNALHGGSDGPAVRPQLRIVDMLTGAPGAGRAL